MSGGLLCRGIVIECEGIASSQGIRAIGAPKPKVGIDRVRSDESGNQKLQRHRGFEEVEQPSSSAAEACFFLTLAVPGLICQRWPFYFGCKMLQILCTAAFVTVLHQDIGELQLAGWRFAARYWGIPISRLLFCVKLLGNCN